MATLTIDSVALEASLAAMLQRWLAGLIDEVLQRAQSIAPYKTGILRALHTTNVEGSGSQIRAICTAYASYALAVHQGTAPHVIEPSTRSVLRFPTKAGTIVYARRVNHPGTTAQPWLYQALASVIGGL